MDDKVKPQPKNPIRFLGAILAGGGLLGLSLPHGIGFWIMVAGAVLLVASVFYEGDFGGLGS